MFPVQAPPRTKAELVAVLDAIEREVLERAAAWEAADESELAHELDFANRHAGEFDSQSLQQARIGPTDDAGLIASLMLESARALRQSLQRSNDPAFKVALLGMECARLTMIARQPELWSEFGRANAEGKRPRQKHSDKLATRVLRALRSNGRTFEGAMNALADAAEELYEIEGVEIIRDRGQWIFRMRGEADEPDLSETFSRGFLRRHKWPKAKSAR